MVTLLWIIALILCVALCAYGITTTVRRSKDRRDQAPAHRRGASIASLSAAPAASPDAAGSWPVGGRGQLSA